MQGAKMTRLFDILFSLAAILILLPFMIPIMIGLKLTGEQDNFYGQVKVFTNVCMKNSLKIAF